MRDNSGEFGKLKVSFVLILGAVLGVLLVLGLFYFRQHQQGTPEVVSAASVAQPATPQAEQPGEDLEQTDPQSEEAAKQVFAELKRFQDATGSGMSYEEYDQMLAGLKDDQSKTLPGFVRHNPSDQTFRQEVDAALREYTAARDWWKTCITNSSVISDAERIERLQAAWNAAQTHLENARQQLPR